MSEQQETDQGGHFAYASFYNNDAGWSDLTDQMQADWHRVAKDCAEHCRCGWQQAAATVVSQAAQIADLQAGLAVLTSRRPLGRNGEITIDGAYLARASDEAHEILNNAGVHGPIVRSDHGPSQLAQRILLLVQQRDDARAALGVLLAQIGDADAAD